MIDFTKYTGQEMRAIVDVLDALTDDLLSSDITESLSIPMREYRRAQVALRTTIEIEAADYAAAEAEKVNRIKDACIAGAPPTDPQADLKDLEWKEQAAAPDMFGWVGDALDDLCAAGEVLSDD